MKLFRKEERDPVVDEAFAHRLGALTQRTRGAVDPYGRQQDPDPIAA
jgi:hypothetical protein